MSMAPTPRTSRVKPVPPAEPSGGAAPLRPPTSSSPTKAPAPRPSSPPSGAAGVASAPPQAKTPPKPPAKAPSKTPPSSSASATQEAEIPFVPGALRLVAVPLVLVFFAGLPYYSLSHSERLESPLHDWFKPSGWVGQSAGVLAFLLFSFLWLYPLRKKLKVMSCTGPLGKWLDVHVVCGCVVPFVAGLHAAWKFDGLIGLGYGAMFIVSLSGIVGRYLYVHIPRRRSGLEMSRDEVIAERHGLLDRISTATGLSRERIRDLLAPANLVQADPPLLESLVLLVKDDFARRRAIRQLIAEWKAQGTATNFDKRLLAEVKTLARREMSLSQQIRILGATLKVFRFWHVAHRPFAIMAFFAVTVHVIVVVAFGATWFW